MVTRAVWALVVVSTGIAGCSSVSTNEVAETGGTSAVAGTGGTGASPSGGAPGGGAAGASTGGTAGSVSAGTGGVGGDSEAPYVISTSPADGEKGVLEGAAIEIQFSEPMDRAATEAALQLGTIPSGAITWNVDGDALQVQPGAKLPLAEGDSVDNVTANSFEFSLSAAAKDLAGNALKAPVQVTFSSARRIQQYLPLVSTHSGMVSQTGMISTTAATVGDTPADEQRKAFFTFSMADLPSGIISVELARFSATQTQVDGAPYSDLGDLRVYSVRFSTLNSSAFDAAPREDLGQLSLSGVTGPKILAVRNGLAADYADRASLGNRSEYRLEFTTATDSDGGSDLASFDLGTVKLLSVYLVD